ncbi:MAG: phosphate ABC transporter substrate-binding protein [Methanocalculaceae archaeon]|jgi:phosphate transport system substrate-binding protein|nr:phosphate ABC transporter substrate-binding protein [Methanocalculaceae archaeon]
MHSLKYFSKVSIAAAILVFVVLAVGCIDAVDPDIITVSTSTTALPAVQALIDAYMDNHTFADIQTKYYGSGAVVTAVSFGISDIGMISRDLAPSEKEGHIFKESVICHDGIAIIAHPSNTVDALTLADLKDTYQGKITNWEKLGGADEQIVLVGFNSASGTRTTFNKMVLHNEDASETMLEYNANGAVQRIVANTPGAIGYVSLGYATDSKVKSFTVEGIAPSVTTVTDRTYPISRPIIMITNGEPTGLAKDFVEFILSVDGKKTLANHGFAPA